MFGRSSPSTSPAMYPRRAPTRMGPWRLLDIVHAVSPWRGALFGSGVHLPELGPPDTATGPRDPAQELPESYLSEREQQQAVERERARRFVGARRPGERAHDAGR